MGALKSLAAAVATALIVSHGATAQSGQESRQTSAQAPLGATTRSKASGMTASDVEPKSSRQAKIKRRPNATEYSFKVWPTFTVVGTVRADTEHGRLACTSFGKRECNWE